jgi:hypothetical protein
MLSFFAYRRWMVATSSRNAEPPRIIPWDGFKEIGVSFHSVAVRGNRRMSEIWNGGVAASWFSLIARSAPGPQGRPNRPPSTISPDHAPRRGTPKPMG